MHIAIDDATRLAYVEVLDDEKALTAIGVSAPRRRVLRELRHHREQLITDNGCAYRSSVHAIACRALGIRHLRTRPYRPQTNGKAETIHPHHARRLGLRRDLPRQPRAHRRPRRLARLLQSPKTPRRPQPQAAHRSPQRAEQPPRVLQLIDRRASTFWAGKSKGLRLLTTHNRAVPSSLEQPTKLLPA